MRCGAVQCGSDFGFWFSYGAVRFGKNRWRIAPHRTRTAVAAYLIFKTLGRRCGSVRIFSFDNPTVQCGAVQCGFVEGKIIRCGSVKPYRTAPQRAVRKNRTWKALETSNAFCRPARIFWCCVPLSFHIFVPVLVHILIVYVFLFHIVVLMLVYICLLYTSPSPRD